MHIRTVTFTTWLVGTGKSALSLSEKAAALAHMYEVCMIQPKNKMHGAEQERFAKIYVNI